MIRTATILVMLGLGTALLVMLDSNADTAMLFTFVGHPLLGAGIALYVWSLVRPVRMTPLEKALYDLSFSDLRPRDFVRFVALGQWCSARAGETIVHRGEELSEVLVLLSGEVELEVDGERIGTAGAGELMGASVILSGEPAWGNARAISDCRYLALPMADVQPWVEQNPAARVALQATVSRDLAEKLRRLTQRSPAGPTD
ncbi:MAG: cyclic nucleotide-binding domain-containing protein [Deltaproteobacteria bacterium]|nr:cyclic nucleotide-binding domain-containing protein [Deltaproteobacteria bacterium]MBW2416693.1 cyclic nucleotide-binding domain-containing protein [Deltaproteobacteria bacterium]